MAREKVKALVKGRKRFDRRERNSAPSGCIATKRRERMMAREKKGDSVEGRERNTPCRCVAI